MFGLSIISWATIKGLMVAGMYSSAIVGGYTLLDGTGAIDFGKSKSAKVVNSMTFDYLAEHEKDAFKDILKDKCQVYNLMKNTD